MSEDSVSDGEKCSPEEGAGVGVRDSLTSVIKRVLLTRYVEQRLAEVRKGCSGRGHREAKGPAGSQLGLEGAARRPESSLLSTWPLSTAVFVVLVFIAPVNNGAPHPI